MKVLNQENIKNSKVILQKKDKEILHLLSHNVRIPISKLAKLLKMSRQSVEYRINVMKREHLIAGSRAVINIKKLGFSSFHFFVNLSKESEKELINNCNKSKYVNALISYSGKYNYEISIMAQNPEEPTQEFFTLINKLKVIDYFPSLLIKTITSKILPEVESEKDLTIKNIKHDPSFQKDFIKKSDYKPDLIDLKICYLLSQNASLSLIEIGKNLRMTKDAISYRIKKLISSNIILNFRPVIDFSVLNLKVQTVLIKSSNRDKESDKKFENYLKNSNSVLWATELFSEFDYLIYVITEKQEEIHAFVQDLREYFSDYIKTYEILFAYQEYKYSFMSEKIIEKS